MQTTQVELSTITAPLSQATTCLYALNTQTRKTNWQSFINLFSFFGVGVVSTLGIQLNIFAKILVVNPSTHFLLAMFEDLL